MRLVRLAVTIIVLITVVSSALPLAAYVADEVPIVTEAHNQRKPEIQGDTVVWEDYRNELDTDIYGYDLVSGTEFLIRSFYQNQVNPSVYQNIVVWTEARDFYAGRLWDVYGYDLNTSTEFVISNGFFSEFNVTIYGNIVAWEDNRNGNYDINGYNTSTHTYFPICTNSPANQGYAEISDDYVVWSDWRNLNGDIYGYDLNTTLEFPICTDPSSQSTPAVDGDIVVWIDNRNGNNDVYGYDISKGTEFPICTDPSTQMHPAISGDYVVWADRRNGGYDIYGYDIKTQREFAICTENGDQTEPSISGNVAVWLDYRSGNYDIYGAYISGGTASVAYPGVMVMAYNKLSKVTALWDSIMSRLAPGMDPEISSKLDMVQEHISNAGSLSNPIYSNGELQKALELLHELDSLI